MKYLSKYIIIITLIIISSEAYSQSDTLVIISKNGAELNFAISTIKMSTFIGLPSITTLTPADITPISVSTGGNITDDGNDSVIARGVCWSTTMNPTTADSKTYDGSGIGSFSSNLTGLSSSTTYYIRAYAANLAGTVYGEEISVTTANINNPININITFGKDTICSGETVMLAAKVTGGDGIYKYEWTGNSIIGDKLQNTINVNPSITTIYTLKVIDNHNKTAQKDFTVNVNPKPTKPAISFSETDTTLISSFITKNIWYLNGSPIAGESTNKISIKTNGSYTVQAVSDFGCYSDLSDPYYFNFDSLAPLVWIDSKTASPGDNLYLNIHLTNSKKLQVLNISKITAILKFNSTLLEPSDKSNAVLKDDFYYIGLDLNSIPLDNVDLVKTLSFTATLGNAEITPLGFENIKAFPDTSVKITGVPGIFTIDICKEGGLRLVKQKKKPTLKINPNPAKNNAEIEYELFKSENVNIFVLDELGQKISTLINEETVSGNHSKSFNLNEFISGVYYIVLQTRTEIRTEKFYIVK